VSFEEGVRLLQMLPVENATPRIAEKFLADAVSDPIVGRMAENSCHGEQDKNDRQIQEPFWAVKVPTVNNSASPGRNGVTTSPVSQR